MHPSRTFVSTHPSFYSQNKSVKNHYFSGMKFEEHEPITIGNDVWVGDCVIILDGVVIGDGSIIGAGAVVTKDVEPYSIVAGNPARLIRYRFEAEVIDFLLEFKWWNKDREWIIDNADLFDDIEKLTKVYLHFGSKA